jgi:hypothetical protein
MKATHPERIFYTSDERRAMLIDTGMHAIMTMNYKDLFLEAKKEATEIVTSLSDDQVIEVLVSMFKENTEYGVKKKHSFFEHVQRVTGRP